MKDNHVLSISKLLNLSDYDIRPMEICWNKVKMTSSRWITCCHQRLVQQSATCTPTKPHVNVHQHSSRTATLLTQSHPNGQSQRFARNPTNHYKSCHPPSPLVNGNGPNSISSSFQTSTPRGTKHNRQPSSLSSTTNSHLTLSTSSPISCSSLSELGRKSSISSSSSNNSFTITHTHGGNAAIRQSRSTIDLASSLQTSDHYVHPRDDSMIRYPRPVFENTITIVNPTEGLLINCQTNGNSSCAQISPEKNVIAVSNEHWIAFYSIETNQSLANLQLPSYCLYWTWIDADLVAVVTKSEVFHWRLTACETAKLRRAVFSLDNDIKDNQITGYSVDPLLGNWCALSTLYIDDDGEIGGRVQIYSKPYARSQCIEAHCCAFTAYKFDDSNQCSTLLVAARREKDRKWKLHIIELGPLPQGNVAHKSITQLLFQHESTSKSGIDNYTSSSGFEDIPLNIVCDGRLGLVYLLSKYGSFYICDLETGVCLHYQHLTEWTEGFAVFTFAYDASTDQLLAVSRSGHVLSIQVSLSRLELGSNAQRKALERIKHKLSMQPNINKEYSPKTAIKYVDQHNQMTNDNEDQHSNQYMSVNSYDSAHSSASTVSSSSGSKLPLSNYHFGCEQMTATGGCSNRYMPTLDYNHQTGSRQPKQQPYRPPVSIDSTNASVSFDGDHRHHQQKQDDEQITRL